MAATLGAEIPTMTTEEVEQTRIAQQESERANLPTTPRSTTSKGQEEAFENLQKMVEEMKAAMDTLIKDAKGKDKIIENLKEKIESKKDKERDADLEAGTSSKKKGRAYKDGGSDEDEWSEKGGKKKLNSMKSKDIPKPDRYNLSPTDFVDWHELFKATMIGIDARWEDILTAFHKEKKTMKPNDVKKILKDIDMDEDDINSVNYQMYVSLLAYTKDALLTKVKANKSAMAMETYRFIYQKGNNATTMNIVNTTTAAMQPSPAKNVAEVESKVGSWKADIKYLEDLGKIPMDNDQKKSILVSILPSTMPNNLQEYLLQHYESIPDYDDFEQKLFDHIALTDQQNKNKNMKTVGAITGSASSDGDEPQADKKYDPEEVSYHDEVGNKWICLATPENKKRKLEEDSDESKEGLGKVPKGKGKAPRNGGCFNCGGEHFARDCPQGPSKGKGKGTDPWVTQTAWNGWYPFRGFQKAKGKGGG